MNLFWAALLGVLQGATEFLPVSSSGHLVIAQRLIPNFSQPGVLFDVILHAGTLFAVILYFRKTLMKITPKYLTLLAIGTIPAGFFGFLFQDTLESFFSDIKMVGLALLLTGVINFLTDKLPLAKSHRYSRPLGSTSLTLCVPIKSGCSNKSRTVKSDISVKDSLLVGVAQAIAIIPGISRSGSTIFQGSLLGIDKEKTAEYSFLLSIPAVAGANILEFQKYGVNVGLNLSFYVVGFIAAVASGYLAINFAIKLLLARKFRFFGFYCLLIGAVAVVLL